jgi:hypothetical protein
MQRDLAFPFKIPAGYRIWAEKAKVVGIHFFLNEAKQFAAGKNQSLILERDRKHPKSRNAVRVMGICRTWFMRKKYLIGHLALELSDQIAKRGDFETLKPILAGIYWSGERQEFVNVRFHILELTLGKW